MTGIVAFLGIIRDAIVWSEIATFAAAVVACFLCYWLGRVTGWERGFDEGLRRWADAIAEADRRDVAPAPSFLRGQRVGRPALRDVK